MRSKGLSQRWSAVFAVVAVLLFAQVAWWTFSFFEQVDHVKDLRLGQLPSSQHSAVLAQAKHKKIMFLSESLFFVALGLFAHSLLYRALRREQKSFEIQKNFVDIIAHESRTPLTALKLRIEALRDQKWGAPTWESELSASLEDIHRLAALFNKAMDLNRMERQALAFEEICLAELVEVILERLKPWLAAKNAHYEVKVIDDIWVEADAYSLENSIRNLVENAVLYNDRPDRRVWIEMDQTAQKAIIRVRDNGPGIEASESEAVFERFYRGRSAKQKPGSGLGLYLAKKIVEAHQGVLRIGECLPGAVFEIEIPKADAHA